MRGSHMKPDTCCFAGCTLVISHIALSFRVSAPLFCLIHECKAHNCRAPAQVPGGYCSSLHACAEKGCHLERSSDPRIAPLCSDHKRLEWRAEEEKREEQKVRMRQKRILRDQERGRK